MVDEKQRLTRIDKALADKILVDRADLGVPHVYEGEDGSYWVLSHELRDFQATSGAVE